MVTKIKKEVLRLININKCVYVKISELRFKNLFTDFPIERDRILWNEEQSQLKDKIIKEGYQPERYGYPEISNSNVCIDGHHRLVILKELYGEDYTLMVKMINRGWVKLTFLVILLKLLGQDLD